MKPKGFVKHLLMLLLALALLSAPGLSAQAAQLPEKLVPVGRTVGIRLDMDGVVVAGFSPEAGDGAVSPAQAAGILPGDIIRGFNGRKISSAADFITEASRLTGESVELKIERAGKSESFSVVPAKCEDGGYRLGLWLRDGVSGIGTITYYDPETGGFGALGHGINELGSGGLVQLGSGFITEAEVIDVIRGGSGAPGELCGKISDKRCGEIEKNTDFGIFGSLDAFDGGDVLPIAGADEIHLGAASILSNVGGCEIGEYGAEICRIYHNSHDGRCFMISITDPRLIEATGGIVQGMSGSPILQDGKIVGAVTHVLVNDPTRGYGIFIENMLDAAG